ncbi:MAG: hypothetical protein IPL46_20720 [Saprospiraceae bacterium]|nr:hypothetical protein [Saprospiraceae bacterium]
MKRFLKIVLTILVLWGALTIFVEMPGPSREKIFMADDSQPSAIILYDADPFYNLDEQVCLGFAESLVEYGYSVKVMTVKAARRQKTAEYNLYVFCANTYNWAPDWAMKNISVKTVMNWREKMWQLLPSVVEPPQDQKGCLMILSMAPEPIYWAPKPTG